jgi:hypothetical protein
MDKDFSNYEALLFQPDKINGFKDFCISHQNELFEYPPNIIWFTISTELNEDPLFEFKSFSIESENTLYSDICESLKVFNSVLINIVDDDERQFKTEYKKCHQNEYEKKGLTYIDFLKKNNRKVISATFKYFEEEAIGGTIFNEYQQTRNIVIANKTKNADPISLVNIMKYQNPITSPFMLFNRKIPFVTEFQFELDNPKSKTALKVKIQIEHIKQLLRLASFCQTQKYIFKYLEKSTKEKSKGLTAIIWDERCEKWLYAAKVHMERINSLMTLYSASSQKSKNCNSRVQTKTNNKELVVKIVENIIYKKNKPEVLTNEEWFKEIKAKHMNKFKNIDLKDESIKKHLHTYFFHKKNSFD